jgi:mannose-6-phosphate isomerase-like protein (cupin superfamily)
MRPLLVASQTAGGITCCGRWTTTSTRLLFPAEAEPRTETCGPIRPLIEEKDGAAGEVHHVEIDNAKLDYHKKTDEFYDIIGGRGTMVLDDGEIELRPGVVVYVPRGVRHKAIGKLTVLTVYIHGGVLEHVHKLE